MVTGSRVLWTGPFVSMLAVNLLGLLLSATSALADDPAREQAQEIGSRGVGTSSERTGPATPPARKPIRKPDRPGNFVYEIINQIQAQSKELCARYGNPADCLEEAEVCLTMRDTGDNQIRLCLNTVPEDGGGSGRLTQKSRVRRLP